jgi:hypothetical protein
MAARSRHDQYSTLNPARGHPRDRPIGTDNRPSVTAPRAGVLGARANRAHLPGILGENEPADLPGLTHNG